MPRRPGGQGHAIDDTTSSEHHEALAAPDGMPLILVHSDVTQSEGDLEGPCGKTADFYPEIGEEYATAWPGARFEAVAEPHDIYANQDLVLGYIDDLLDS